MTPLASYIAKQYCLPVRRREIHDDLGFGGITSCHCFEMTDVIPLFEFIQEQNRRLASENRATDYARQNLKYMFLPAPDTWLEWKIPGNQGRWGYWLKEFDEKICVASALKVTGYPAFTFPIGTMRKPRNALEQFGWEFPSQPGEFFPDFAKPLLERINFGDEIGAVPVYLALINTPRIIGRKQHMPHAGLAKRLKMAGVTFPLLAWTEIKLEVGPPKIAGDEIHEARLTGRKALHFCRAHLRFRMGRLEYVSSHWRGDASLGIKRSRYKMKRAG